MRLKFENNFSANVLFPRKFAESSIASPVATRKMVRVIHLGGLTRSALRLYPRPGSAALPTVMSMDVESSSAAFGRRRQSCAIKLKALVNSSD